MSDNLELWASVSRVPPENLKAFNRGTFKGTAIKPAWAYKAMTEAVGPAGAVWSIGEPSFTLVDGVKGEKLVYCVVTVNFRGGSIVGVGGDKVIKYTPPNERENRPERWDNDDEAFKKAYTDALTNALVKLGVGADIHMGLWDGNKYVDDAPTDSGAEEDRAARGAKTRPISDVEARALFKELKNELVTCASEAEVMRFEREAAPRIVLLGDWAVHIINAILEHRQFILTKKEKAA